MLSLNNVAVTFHPGTVNEVRALDDLEMHVNSGEFITIIGANGAGKSTLFNVIAGSVAANAGKIILDGANVTEWPEHRRSKFIGRVFQNPLMGTCPGLTIRENLSLAAMRGHRVGLRPGIKKQNEEWFLEMLHGVKLGLEKRLDTDVAMLSGGQRQAITLIMATLLKPKLLLLDEHTAALDPNAAAEVIDLTVQLAEEYQLTVIMITHSMQQACVVGDRVVMMNRGKILFDVHGEERQHLRPSDLIERFRALNTGVALADRNLLD